MRHPAYSRSQPLSLLWLLLPAVALGSSFAVFAARGDDGWSVVAPIVAVHALLLALFGRLTIEVGSDRIEWRFGFLGFPRWSLALDEVLAVEAARTRWIDGWGIHRTAEGWIYNAQGFGAVRLRCRNGRTLRLGSDEPERLASFIVARLPKH